MRHYDITALFYCIDEFCRVYSEWEKHKLLPKVGKRDRSGKLSLSEMLCIEIMFHLSGFRDFKTFYEYGINHKYKDHFQELPCYARFVQIKKKLFMPLSILLQSLSGRKTGTYIVDSTSLKVCHNRRIRSHKVFESLAARGKTTMGWFYGFKLHVVINNYGEIVAIKFTAGNVNDRTVLDELTNGLRGKIFGDKGYISKELFAELWRRGLQLITGIRKNMKNYLMPLLDKIMLKGRFIVESVFHILKNHMNLEHTRHRSPTNFFVNALACLVAYAFRINKPAFKLAVQSLSHN
jgi:hypothetical protein